MAGTFLQSIINLNVYVRKKNCNWIAVPVPHSEETNYHPKTTLSFVWFDLGLLSLNCHGDFLPGKEKREITSPNFGRRSS